MNEREIRSYDYVNQPYEIVRDALCNDAQSVFRTATMAAASRAEDVAAQLQVEIAGLQVGAEVAVKVGSPEETKESSSTRVTRIPISWEAAKRPRLFPLMNAVLSIYPLTRTETQLDFVGRYDPPLGAFGGVVDALVGHKLAEASVHRFVADIAEDLRRRLSR